ncbi:MAG: hypothetical protein ABGZ17_09125 [Planctomycetaceae bacterium]
MRTFAIRCIPLCFVFLQGCAVIVCNTTDEAVLFKGEDGSEATVQPCECEQLTTIQPSEFGLGTNFGVFCDIDVCGEDGNELGERTVAPSQFNTTNETYAVWNGFPVGFTDSEPPNLQDCEPPMEEPPGDG